MLVAHPAICAHFQPSPVVFKVNTHVGVGLFYVVCYLLLEFLDLANQYEYILWGCAEIDNQVTAEKYKNFDNLDR